jgi:hypothetical protein
MLMLFHFRIEARYPTGALWILNRVSPTPFFFIRCRLPTVLFIFVPRAHADV